jgi:MFS family permease
MLCYSVRYWRSDLTAYLGTMQLSSKVRRWQAALQGQHVRASVPSLVRVRDVVVLLNTTAVGVCIGLVCILAPVYAGLTATYGTYDHQYAWVLSSVLLSGRAPFAVCFVVYMMALGLSVGALFVGHKHLTAPVQRDEPSQAQQTGFLRIILASTLYLVMNIVVVSIVNFAFIATSIYTSAVYQLAISAFKVGWNLFVAPYFSRWLAYELSAGRADWFTLELFVSIMNNIGIPLLAVVLVSPQCLLDLLGIPMATKIADLGDLLYLDEPFYYSYQCSYVFMDFYSAAFVYASLMASFGTPLLELLALQLLLRAQRESFWYRCTAAVLPRILKPVEADPERIPDRSVLRPFFDTTQFLVAQLTSLALILTMGTVFPPLAVPVAVTMVLTAIFVMLKVGRLLTNASEEKQHKYAEIIEQECANVATPTTMQRAFWLILWFGCSFYTLFLFDTLGDAVGFYAAYWVLIVVPLLPVVSVGAYIVYLLFAVGAKRHTEVPEASSVELGAAVSPLATATQK